MNKYSKVNVKFLSVISYIGPLFVVGKFSLEKDCEQVRFHYRQGETLFFTMLVLLIVNTILNFTLSSMFEALSVICFLFYIGIAVAWLILSIMGVTSAFSGSKLSLPIIGEIANKFGKK